MLLLIMSKNDGVRRRVEDRGKGGIEDAPGERLPVAARRRLHLMEAEAPVHLVQRFPADAAQMGAGVSALRDFSGVLESRQRQEAFSMVETGSA